MADTGNFLVRWVSYPLGGLLLLGNTSTLAGSVIPGDRGALRFAIICHHLLSLLSFVIIRSFSLFPYLVSMGVKFASLIALSLLFLVLQGRGTRTVTRYRGVHPLAWLVNRYVRSCVRSYDLLQFICCWIAL